MNKTLPNTPGIKVQSAISISVFVFLLALSTGAAAQEVAQTGNTFFETNTMSVSSLALGEIVWIAITLVFSFGLNLYLRRNEKKPQKTSISEPSHLLQQPVTVPVKQKAEAIKNIRIKRANKLAHKFAYQREHVMQPFSAVQYLTVNHKETGVTS